MLEENGVVPSLEHGVPLQDNSKRTQHDCARQAQVVQGLDLGKLQLLQHFLAQNHCDGLANARSHHQCEARGRGVKFTIDLDDCSHNDDQNAPHGWSGRHLHLAEKHDQEHDGRCECLQHLYEAHGEKQVDRIARCQRHSPCRCDGEHRPQIGAASYSGLRLGAQLRQTEPHQDAREQHRGDKATATQAQWIREVEVLHDVLV
mmetsp:Transcript_62750/g.168642  ORF Transcript_62750/g.168642 Transcript_62750/m.168642 type:complete len:203 (-) Transcript_62750:165-773(-)